jgi:hypothetical protein
MPEFYAGEAKTAKVTMRNPTNKFFSYTGALVIGLPEVARAEAAFSIPALGEKEVSFPVTMPAAPGTYPVNIGVASGGILIAAFVSDPVTIVPPTLASQSSLGSILIQAVDGKPFTLVQGNIAVLSEPTVKAFLYDVNAPSAAEDKSGILLTFKNLSLPAYNPDNFININFRYQYVLPGATWPYSDAPQCWASMQLPSSPGGVYTIKFLRWYGGYWKPGIYDGVFQWGLQYFDQPVASMVGSFTIKNMVQCTGTGAYID